MNRRFVLIPLAVLLLVALVVARSLTGDSGNATADIGKLEKNYRASAPNVVVVMTDDQAIDTMRAMPQTRNLLGKHGVEFRNAVISYPLCCPSRAAFLTGQYAHNNGVRNNKPPEGSISALDQKQTLAVWLRQAGYHTNFVGKYLNGYGKSANGGKTFVPPGWVNWIALTSGDKTSAYDYDLNENGKLVHYGSGESDYKTDVLARHARDVVREQAGRSRPFFLLVMTSAPHTDNGLPKRAARNPLPAKRHRGDFGKVALPKPAAFNEKDVRDKPGWVSRKSKISAKKQREMRRTYISQLESLEAVDELVGTLVRQLEEEKALRDTIVIFTSDNGYMRGQHRISSGKALPYEESIGVPLLIRGPGFPARGKIDELAVNVDLTPTILEAARVEPGEKTDGVPLQPIVRGKRSRGEVLLEIFGRKDGDLLGVRNDRYMFARHAGGEQELYDLKNDPHQLQNVAGRKSYAKAQRHLSKRLARLRDCEGESCR